MLAPSGVRRLVLIGAAALAVGLLVRGDSSAASGGSGPVVVMSGLDNPRGLAFGPDGSLYVAEAGRGGPGPTVVLRGQPQSYGPSGAVSRLRWGVQQRVAVGLPSTISPTGEVTGPHDVSLLGLGGCFVTVGFGADPSLRAAFGPGGAEFGTLVRILPFGQWQVVSDLSAHEAEYNPAGGPVDSNPYGILAAPEGCVLTDAGANALLRIGANGAISTLGVFPSRPARDTDAVPTCVTRGPDGAYYVGELTGVPFAAGAARVYRVAPGGAPTVYLEGFKTIIDLEFDRHGNLYVLQHATGPVFFSGPGEVIRVAPDGTRTVVAAGLTRPGSLVLEADCALYVSNRSTSVGTGEVLRFPL